MADQEATRIVKWAAAGAVLATLVGLAGCAPAPGLAVVDLEAVARALGRDDAMTQQVNVVNESLRLQLREAAERLREELQAEQDAIGDDASESDQARFEQLLAEANRRLEDTQRAALMRSTQFRQAVVSDFRREVVIVAREIAARSDIPAVLSSDASLLWYDRALDITDEVIAEMRARSREPAPATGAAGSGAQDAGDDG
jgi:Skp family chaperone for outer membrane proteins